MKNEESNTNNNIVLTPQEGAFVMGMTVFTTIITLMQQRTIPDLNDKETCINWLKDIVQEALLNKFDNEEMCKLFNSIGMPIQEEFTALFGDIFEKMDPAKREISEAMNYYEEGYNLVELLVKRKKENEEKEEKGIRFS